MEKEIRPGSQGISFRPLTRGLGLDHQSDGMPYLPNGAKVRRMRSSAPMATPMPRAPRFDAVEQRAGELVQAPVGTRPAQAIIDNFEAPGKTAQATPPIAPTPTPTELQAEGVPAHFTRRILAYALDTVFSITLFSAIVWVSFYWNGIDLSQLVLSGRGNQLLLPLSLLFLVVHAAYFLIQETSWRATLGKTLLGIRVHSASGMSALARALCFYLAAVPMGIGLFWYFFQPRRRCWHDVVTNSEVVVHRGVA